MKLNYINGGEYSVSICSPTNITELKQALKISLSGRQALFVTTPTVYELWKDIFFGITKDLSVRTLVINADEKFKTLDTALLVAKEAADCGIGRLGVLVSVGGGSCMDIVGVAASLIRRGISHIRIPTTLVGQIDAGLGLKTGVNFYGKKNYLGSFYPPDSVVVFPDFLHTLGADHIRQGISEIVKIAMMRDKQLFELVEQHGQQLIESSFSAPLNVAIDVISMSANDMIEELESNPFEKLTFERLVDFGHCFSPLIEVKSGYSISHGDAVAMDMAFSLEIARELSFLDENLSDHLLSVQLKLGLPCYSDELTVSLCEKAIEATVLHRGGDINLPLPVGIGKAGFLKNADLLTKSTLERALQSLVGKVRLHA